MAATSPLDELDSPILLVIVLTDGVLDDELELTAALRREHLGVDAEPNQRFHYASCSLVTEPLTPWQKRSGKRLSYVEHWARFTVEQMRAKLELKKTGGCSCGKDDFLCRTMCGTLLGPGAVDGDDSTRVRRPEPQRQGPD